MGNQTFIENQGKNTQEEWLSKLTDRQKKEVLSLPDEIRNRYSKLTEEEWNIYFKPEKTKEERTLLSIGFARYEVEKANAEKLLNSREIMARVGVPYRFLDASKDQIQPDLWEKIKSFSEGDSLYIHGPVGVGKTHLLAAMVREHYESFVYKALLTKDDQCIAYCNAPEGIRMISIPVLLAKIKASYQAQPREDGEDRIETAQEMIDRYAGQNYIFSYLCKAIIFDDFGSERPTEWMLETLYLIIDGRYSRRKQTVFTSNLSLEQLSERLGDRIASRISEMCTVVKIEGKDRRIR